MRVLDHLRGPAVLAGCLTLLAATTAGAQNLPALSHGNVLGDSVTITVRSSPSAYCLLFWGITRGRTSYDLPASLGGRVTVGVAPSLLFASSLDGTITLNRQGRWTYRLVVPAALKGFLHTLYFQAVAFQLQGATLVPAVSNLLEIDLASANEPQSQLQRALELVRRDRTRVQSRRQLRRYQWTGGSFFDRRRLGTHQGAYHFDPFGNRIFRPRVLWR